MHVLRQDKWLRWSLVALAVAAFAWFLLCHTTFVVAYTLDSAPANLGQTHAWCSSVVGQAYVEAGVGQSVGACASSDKWWGVAGGLELGMIIAGVVAAFRVYRHNFPKRSTPAQQEYWPR